MQNDQNSLLNINMSTSCTPTQSDILIPELFLTDYQSLPNTSVIECAIASSSRNTRKYINVNI